MSVYICTVSVYVQYLCTGVYKVCVLGRNGERFGGYLFLLVNCEADSIEGLGQFKWAFSQITSVIVCVQVPRCSHQDRAWEALKFSREGQI